MGKACGPYGGEGRCVHGNLGKETLGRPSRIWEDSIKMVLKELGWGSGLDLSGTG
jgi:hypothetical protein